MLQTLNATDVRKDWSAVVDNTLRIKPQFFKRTRDYLFLSDLHFMEDLLSGYQYTAERFVEGDGSITLSLNEIDLVENGMDDAEVLNKLSHAILEYAEDFYADFSYWGSAPNRKAHIPYVFKALFIGDTQKIAEGIKCQAGKI